MQFINNIQENELIVLISLFLVTLLFGFFLGYLIRSLRSAKEVAVEREARITLEASLKHQEQIDVERDTALELAKERLENAFHDLANESLEKNNQFFLQLASQKFNNQQQFATNELEKRKEAIQKILQPIGEALQKTESQIRQIEKERTQSFGELNQRINDLKFTHTDLQKETRKLVNALRKPEVRGRWGEQTLKRMVELAGLVEHADFDEQVIAKHSEHRLRPDLVINLPDERQIIIDAKTPLQAYLDALEAESDHERDQHLQRHLQAIKTHIKQLSAKDYWASFEKSPDFVVLFIPGEQFLSAALDLEPNLFDHALSFKIILATPNNLLALLKTVNYGWKQVQLAKNATEIKSLAENLYQRLTVFTQHIEKIGKSLEQSNKAYNSAVGSLERSVLPSARKFTEMGISQKNDINVLNPIDTPLRTPQENKSEK